MYLLGFKRLSLTYKSSLPLITPNPPTVYRVLPLSLLIPLYLYFLPYLSSTYLLILSTSTRDRRSRVGWYFALYTLYTHFTYISSLYHPYIVRVLISSHPISKIGWVFILHSLFILPSLSVFFYSYISYLILFLYCTYYTTISTLLPVGCSTPYGVWFTSYLFYCLLLLYSYIYFFLSIISLLYYLILYIYLLFYP